MIVSDCKAPFTDAHNIYNACFPRLKTGLEQFRNSLGLGSGTQLLLRRNGDAVIGFAAVRADGILLLCVHTLHRYRGIGTGLLKEAEGLIAQAGYSQVRLGLGGGKYLVQGVPTVGDCQFFERRGYWASWVSIDMILRLEEFDLGQLEGYPYCSGVAFRQYRQASPAILQAVEKINPSWVEYYESADDIIVAENEGEITACTILIKSGLPFAINFNGSAGGLGCLGTVPQYRNQGIGLTLAAYATGILKKQGFAHSYLGYTWLREWYGRLGYMPYAEFWMGEKQLSQ